MIVSTASATAPVRPEVAPPAGLKVKNGKVQLIFGRHLCVEWDSHTYLKAVAEVSSEYEGSDDRTGGTFRIVKVTGCEPPVALRIARDPKTQAGKKEVLRDCALIPDLEHKNIVPFLSVLNTETYGLVEVMPLYDGDLFDYLSNQSFTPSELCNITLPVCCALGWLHQKDIVHSDIRPENILYHEAGKHLKIVLTDFGFSGRTSTKFLTLTSNGAPEISEYWWADDSPTGLLAGVDFPKRMYRMTGNDVWSLGFLVRLMMEYFDRDNEADFNIRELLSPERSQQHIATLIDTLRERTEEEKDLPQNQQTTCYCRVGGEEDKQAATRLLHIAREAMTVNMGQRPGIDAVRTALEAIPGAGQEPA